MSDKWAIEETVIATARPDGSKFDMMKALMQAQKLFSDGKPIGIEQMAAAGEVNTKAMQDGKLTYGEVRDSLKATGITGIANVPDAAELAKIQSHVNAPKTQAQSAGPAI